MRRFWATLLLLLTLCACAAFEVESPPQDVFERPHYLSDLGPLPGGMHIVMATDLHYQPQVSEAAAALAPQMYYLNALIDTLVFETAELCPAALVLCGDLTNNGRLHEHRALIQRLTPLLDAGVAVYVIPGNHDFGEVTPEIFAELYRDFGYGAALSRAPGSLSYLAHIGDDTYIAMLDSTRYRSGGALPNGDIDMATLLWLDSALDEYLPENGVLLSASHHYLLPHDYAPYLGNLQVASAEQVVPFLSHRGVYLHLSGHRHGHHILTDGGITEVVGDQLFSFPHFYGVIGVDREAADITYQARCLDVDSFARRAGLTDPDLLGFNGLSYTYARAGTERFADNMLVGITAPDDALRAMRTFWHALIAGLGDGTFYLSQDTLRQSDGYAYWVRLGTDSPFYPWSMFLMEEAVAHPYRITVALR